MKKLFIIASLITIFATGILVYSGQLSPQKETESKKQSTTQKQESTKNVIAIKQIPSTEKSQQPGTENQNKTYIKTPDERIATFTGWLVIVACIQALIFIAQAIAMSIQAKHLRRTVVATEKSVQAVIRMELPIIRAAPDDLIATTELIGENEPYSGAIIHDRPPGKYSAFSVRSFKNFGRSPAFPETIVTGWMVAAKLPNKPQYTKSSTLRHSAVIMPQEEFRADVHSGIELTKDEMREISESRLWLWFYGCLYYKDFMNDEREYRFCWRYSNQNPKGMSPYYLFSSDGAPPKEYTRNT